MFYSSASWPEGRKAGCLKYTHIVLHVDTKKAKRLNDKAIVLRWHKGFKGTLVTHKFIQGDKLDSAEQESLKLTIKEYKKRLHSISWFMRTLNESIARQANKEDGCEGRLYSHPSMALTLRTA